MIPVQWQKAKEIFGDAIKFAPDERDRFLDENCGGDEALRREVESLLANSEDADDFLEQPAVGQVAEAIIGNTEKLHVGQNISRYKIIQLLGTGGMGEVYLAGDTRLHRQVALKTLPHYANGSQQHVQRFLREARAASALNHPNICTIYEINDDGDTPFIAMEYVVGETLDKKIKTQLEPSQILDIALQVADALAEAHAHNIVHRDIKPANVIVNPRGQAKVLDFGLAKKIAGESEDETEPLISQAGMIIGTASYMSPEQARGKEVDARSDIFSFGVVLHEMVAGKPPFDGENAVDIISSILHKEPEPLRKLMPEVSPDLERIVNKLLRKDREERFQTVKDLLVDLKSLQKRLEFEAETQSFTAGIVKEIPDLPMNNLTGNFSPIIGREKEIAEIENLLRRKDVRLVTMTGVGGTGKTRLAQAVAQGMLPEFIDGVFFVELAAITNPELVASAIAQLLGVKEAGGKPILESLNDYLRGRQMLLVIDNFEQVADAAPNIAELISATDNLKILITSRVLLHSSKEREFVVPPLALPDDTAQVSLDELSNYEAIKLFVERARYAKPNFAISEENAKSVVEICSRLDGLPLAIELAAARVKTLTPQAILTKLENRLKLLTGGARDLPVRQQTMRGAIEWSYDLLNEDEKALFRRLAVFAGGFTFEAAEAIAEVEKTSKEEGETHRSLPKDFDVSNTNDRNAKENSIVPNLSLTPILTFSLPALEGITSLIDKSLLVAKEQTDGEIRFRMLEVVREYALESLETSDEAEAIRHRHAAYFLALGEAAEPHLTGTESVKWLNRLEDEHDNLRDALAWLLENDAEMAARMAAAIRVFWTNHSHLTEGRKWLKAALERASQNTTASVRFKLLNGLGLAARQQGDNLAARKFYEEGLAAGRAANDLRQIAQSTKGLGVVAYLQVDFPAAQKFIKEGLAIERELNDKFGIARSLNILGELSRMKGDNAAAHPLFEESLEIFRQFGNSEGVSGTLNNLAAIAYGESDFAAARSYYVEALTTAHELGEKIILSFSLDGFAALAAESGESERAAKLAGAAERLLETVGFEIELADRQFRDAYIAKLKTKMDEAAFANLYEQGRKLKLEEAVSLCLEENNGRTQILATTGEVNKTTAGIKYTFARHIKRHKPLAAFTLIVLLVAIGFGIWYFGIGSADTKQIESIAVLPFQNDSESGETEYLSDGMTESLITRLAQLPNLNVKARSSVFRYKGKEDELQRIGKELNVEAILTGRIVRRGNDLTLYITLVDAATEKVLWKSDYNRSMTNLVALQSDVARDVSNKLQLKLSGADVQRLTKTYTANADAYQLYMKGRFHLLKGIGSEPETVISYFQQAIEADPNYALAYAGLADAYRGRSVGGEMPSAEFMPKAKAAAIKAIEIDDTLAEAHANLGHVMFWYDWDWSAAEKEYKRALELDPNSPDALQFYAHLLTSSGRHPEALAKIKLARELDPVNLRVNAIEGMLLLYAGQTDEAIARLQQNLELDPNFRLTHMFAARAYIEKGMFDEAIAATRKSRELSAVSSEPIAYGAYALSRSGKLAEARAALDELLGWSKTRWIPPYNFALVYNALGERDKALDYLEKGFAEKDVRMVWLKVEPKLNNLRSQPRFIELMKRMN